MLIGFCKNVFVPMYMHMYIGRCVRVCAYAYVCLWMYFFLVCMFVCIDVDAYVYKCIRGYAYVCNCVSVYVCMYVRMSFCVWVYAYMLYVYKRTYCKHVYIFYA